MVKLDKIYTRGGDKGVTSLGDGTRLSKHHLRIDAIGSVDEVNACIGVAKAYSESSLQIILSNIQHDLFDLGADLCIPRDKSANKKALRIQAEQVTRLEHVIDDFNKDLAPLTSFVLPGGSIMSSYLHLARTVVRRAERSLTCLNEQEEINMFSIAYLNRLSDLLFVLSRFYNHKGKEDILWQPAKNIHTAKA